jgi:CHAT domain-containing protein
MYPNLFLLQGTGKGRFRPVLLCILFVFHTEGCKTPSIIATQEQQTADGYFNNHQYPEAIDHYVKYLEASRKLGVYRDLTMEADVCRKIADGHTMLGSYKQAIPYVRNALAIDSTQNNPREFIEDYRLHGKIYLYMGDYQHGIRYLEKTLQLNEGMESSIKNLNKLSIADTYLALGQTYASLGQVPDAIKDGRAALDLYTSVNDWKGLMEATLLLGVMHIEEGLIEPGKKFLTDSKTMAGEHGISAARQNLALGEVSANEGLYEDALRYKLEALRQASATRILAQLIWINIGVGDVYQSIGDVNQAKKYYRRARELKDSSEMEAKSLQASMDLRLGDMQKAYGYFSQSGSLVGAGLACLRLGESMIRQQLSDSALFYYAEAESNFRQASNNQGIATATLRQGQVYIDMNKPAEAKTYLDLASGYDAYPELVWQQWYHRGRLAELNHLPDQARDDYIKAIDKIESIRGHFSIEEFKSSYLENKMDVYDRLINLLEQQQKYEDALMYSERARARSFLDMLANRKIDYRSTTDKELISHEQDLRLQIQQLTQMIQKTDMQGEGSAEVRGVSRGQLRDGLTQAQEQYDEVMQQLKLMNSAYLSLVSIDPVKLTEVQKELNPTTALLEYWVGKDNLIIWLIRKDRLQIKKVSIGATDLQMGVEYARRYIAGNSLPRAKERLGSLYETLIMPVESLLGGVETLGIIPNGPLHFLPFQALIDKSGKYLVQKYNIFYAPSSSVYVMCRGKPYVTKGNMLGLALGDQAIGDFEGLPGTEAELKQIEPLFPNGKFVSGSGSTETLVKEEIGKYDLIHLATHGYFSRQQPLHSFLLFPATEQDDGHLNVFEVFEMNIRAGIVTLSACETGLGDLSKGDDLVGLSRAFIYAGAPAVIVSLWSVADYPTALLMSDFYKYLSNHSAYEALTLAQRDVMKTYDSPLFWAPFMLIGNPGD